MAGCVAYSRLMYANVEAASSKSPLWNCALPISIHAFHRNGLYSRRLSHSRSLSVFLRLLFHSGLFLMLCCFIAFCAFSMARS